MAKAEYTPISPVGQCKTCGKSFEQVIGRGKWRSYCSDACKPKEKTPSKRCDIDGCERHARSNTAAYCEKHYYQVRRIGRIGTLVDKNHYDNCQHCGTPTGGSKHCSHRCENRHRKGMPVTAECASCGQKFVPIGKTSTCSDGCARENTRKVCRDRYARLMKEDPAFRERVRRYEYRRKALKRQAYVEDVEREEVMRRSRWICHLCGDKIPKSAVWPDPRFGSVDHVLPLARGGKHSYANCKAAHLACNCRKNATPIGQLGLEFIG